MFCPIMAYREAAIIWQADWRRRGARKKNAVSGKNTV
jgi:hypothetical protein